MVKISNNVFNKFLTDLRKGRIKVPMSMKSSMEAYYTTCSKKYLYKTREMVNRELCRRARERDEYEERLLTGWKAMATFMSGVACAMACRSVLRWSKGHTPYGTRPMHGACWTPLELHIVFMLYDKNVVNWSLYANPLRWGHGFTGLIGQYNFERAWVDEETHRKRLWLNEEVLF